MIRYVHMFVRIPNKDEHLKLRKRMKGVEFTDVCFKIGNKEYPMSYEQLEKILKEIVIS